MRTNIQQKEFERAKELVKRRNNAKLEGHPDSEMLAEMDILKRRFNEDLAKIEAHPTAKMAAKFRKENFCESDADPWGPGTEEQGKEEEDEVSKMSDEMSSLLSEARAIGELLRSRAEEVYWESEFPKLMGIPVKLVKVGSLREARARLSRMHEAEEQGCPFGINRD